ncbi:helix-turn-helix domain-containing protein [Halpernia sp.]|uniref:helix-turn-helix domain-containing protein n=1 Tax=Halpernia sp. TaxID=2782209 RepID=UPI003A937EBB
MNLNERIKKILEESKLSSSEFADEIDVQKSSISHVTSGRNKPSLEFITKIKARFPEISWDWLINGEGEMKPVSEKYSDEENKKNSTEKKTVALPDLFSLIDDDQFGITESEDRIKKDTPREFFIPNNDSKKIEINDSQRLEQNLSKSNLQVTENDKVTLTKIVMFYSNGKFESFEP